MKRYRMEDVAYDPSEKEATPDGSWCKWSDVEPLLSRLENALDKSREHEDIAYDVIKERNELRGRLDAAMRVVEAAKKSSDWDHEMCEALKSWDELEGGE